MCVYTCGGHTSPGTGHTLADVQTLQAAALAGVQIAVFSY